MSACPVLNGVGFFPLEIGCAATFESLCVGLFGREWCVFSSAAVDRDARGRGCISSQNQPRINQISLPISLDGHIPSLFGPVVTCGDTRRNNPPDYLFEGFKVGRWFCLRGRPDFDHSLGMETQPLKKVGERERSIRPVFH